ncbi:MAG: nucleotidyltransferase substrate binding protein [Magnetococcales bacterium]|nr:nucleotidyltransferase substrate binding protein [Magnetococcales bacterium]
MHNFLTWSSRISSDWWVPGTAIRGAFRNGLIEHGDIWMQMIVDRNLSSHTYDEKQAATLADTIMARYYPAFKSMALHFSRRYDQQEEET